MKQEIYGHLTLDSMATHVPHNFKVPDGTKTLRLEFTHTPEHPGVGNIPHQLSISVYGPNGARGTRHNNDDQQPIISTNWASPGYLSGPIEPGEWTVELDVHRILPPGSVDYQINVFCENDVTDSKGPKPVPMRPDSVRRRGPGWYTGDLHGHTYHSDGDFSPAEFLEEAWKRGYDFVALTDHNTQSAVPEITSLAGEAMTILGGVELTTFNGHAVVLGVSEWTEWRVKDGSSMSALASHLQDRGALYIIAHPKSEGHPICTGCRWAFSDMMPGPARHVEVWNRGWAGSHNEPGLRQFYKWLNEGFRMVASSGTDSHRPMPPEVRIGSNRVYAHDNTQHEILAGLRRGHCFVTSGPEISFTAETEDSKASMGDLVKPGQLKLKMGWSVGLNGFDPSDLEAVLIKNNEAFGRWSCGDHEDSEFATISEEADWFTLELRDQKGDLHALSNPIFVGQQVGTWR